MCSPFTIDIRPRRLPAEIKQIAETVKDHGIRCIVKNDRYDSIEASVPGPKETPYEEMKFLISMDFDSHYPFRPPVVKFVTPVYHPNIDRDGKICLDVLQMPPGGSYNPAITLESILLSIQLLLACPNPDDPLRNDVSDEYKYNRELFNQNAKKYSGSTQDVNETDQTEADDSESMEAEDKPSANDDNGHAENRTLPDAEKTGDESKEEAAPTTSKANRKRKHDDS